jgi:hypothetical protein
MVMPDLLARRWVQCKYIVVMYITALITSGVISIEMFGSLR